MSLFLHVMVVIIFCLNIRQTSNSNRTDTLFSYSTLFRSVNAVVSGYMQTEMTLGLEGEKLQSIMRRSPLRRLATPEDVEGAVAYLLGPDSAAVTGTIL